MSKGHKATGQWDQHHYRKLRAVVTASTEPHMRLKMGLHSPVPSLVVSAVTVPGPRNEV